MNKKIILLIIIICIFLATVAIKIFFFTRVRTWNTFYTDFLFTLRYRLQGREKISSNLCVFNIDDQDIYQLQITLNNRDIFSEIIKTLADSGVTTIAFDIMFEHSQSTESDGKLVYNTQEAGIVLFPAKEIQKQNGNHVIQPEDAIQQKYTWHPHIYVAGNSWAIDELSTPFTELALAAKGLGVINFTPDPDGITRRVPLIFTGEKGYYFSFILVAIIHYFNIQPQNIIINFGEEIKLNNAHLPDGTVRDVRIPVDKEGKMLINYAAPYTDSFQFYPVRELINFRDNPAEYANFQELLADTLVVVTETSSVNVNNVTTIFNPVVPHNEVLVNAINTILTENFLYEPTQIDVLSILIPVLLFSILIISLLKLNFIKVILSAFFIFVCLGAGSFLLFIKANRLCILFSDLIGFGLSIIIIIVYEFITVRQERFRYQSEYEKMKTNATVRKETAETIEIDENVCREYYVTPRQREILLFMQQRYTYKKIADFLNITEGAIKSQIWRLKQSVGIFDKNKLLKKFFPY